MDANIAPPQGLDGLAPPPRTVPLHVKVDELFGGAWSMIGWAFLGFGLIFVWIFVLNADFSGWRFGGALERAVARATACRGTDFSEGHNRYRPGHPIYATDFFFNLDGKTVLGTSYGFDCYQAGQDAPVEFPPGRPDLARIRGFRRAPMGPGVSFLLLFPVFGLSFIGFSIATGLRDIRLLERGVVGPGTVVGKRATSTRIDNRTLYELDVRFKDAFGREVTFQTKTCFPEKVEGEGRHEVFYDPDRPHDAIAADALPEPLYVESSGALSSDGWLRAMPLLFLPALTVVGHGAYWLWRLAAVPGSDGWGRAALDLVLTPLFAVNHALSWLIHLAL